MEGQKLIGSKSANRGPVNSAEGRQDQLFQGARRWLN
jgi:hypothetical protein